MKNRYTYVMSDIHGDFNRFERAIREIDYDEEKDLLYIIGDAIDRGRKNLEMLNYIKTHPAIRFIKGNHELFLEMYLRGDLSAQTYEAYGGSNTRNEIDALTEEQRLEWYRYLNRLPLYAELELGDKAFVLTQSGLHADYMVRNKDATYSVMESIKKAAECAKYSWLISGDIHYMPAKILKSLDKFLIVGHTPCQHLNADESYHIFKNKAYHYICIDGGCQVQENGKLAVLRMEDEKEWYF